MSTSSAGPAAALIRTAFLALVYALAGWVWIALWLHAVQAGVRAQLGAALPPLGLTFLALKRLRRCAHLFSGRAQASSARLAPADGWAALLLFVSGALIGVALLSNAAIVVGAVAVTLGFIPWDRIAFLDRHPGAACAATSTGLACAMTLGWNHVAVMFLPIAAWVLWLGACLSLLLTAAHSQKPPAERAPSV